MLLHGTLDEYLQCIASARGAVAGNRPAGLAGIPHRLYFAFCCDWFFVSKLAKGVAFRYLLRPDSSVRRKVITISCCMVVPMVIIMSFYGAAEGCFHTGMWSGIVLQWLHNIPFNFIMALPYQLIIAGPLVRFVFRKAFPVGSITA